MVNQVRESAIRNPQSAIQESAILTRRRFLFGLGLPLLAGCANFPMLRPNPTPPPAPIPQEVPQADSLIDYLNYHSRQVQSINVADLDLDAKQNGQGAGLRGWLVCQKPRNFRLVAKVIANPEIDMGSNNNEFWYWIRRMEPHPYLFHCSYQDLGHGPVCRSPSSPNG